MFKDKQYGPPPAMLVLNKIIYQTIGKTDSIKNECDSCFDTDNCDQCSVCHVYITGDYLMCPSSPRAALCNECFEHTEYTLLDFIHSNYERYVTSVVNDFIDYPAMLHTQILELSHEVRASLPMIYITKCIYDDLRVEFPNSLIFKRLQIDLDAWTSYGAVKMLKFSSIRTIIVNNFLFDYTEELKTIKKAAKCIESGKKRKREQTTLEHLKKWIPSIKIGDIRDANKEQEALVVEEGFLTTAQLLQFFASKR